MIKKIYLIVLLLFVTILGRVIIQNIQNDEEEKAKEVEEIIEDNEKSDHLIFDGAFLLSSSPTFFQNGTIEIQILGSKFENIDHIDLISQYSWNTNIAQAVFKAESGLNPEAINPNDYHRKGNCRGSYGIAQMGCVHFGYYGLTENNWSNPEININAAYLLWLERGWKEWGAYTNGSYLQYLK